MKNFGWWLVLLLSLVLLGYGCWIMVNAGMKQVSRLKGLFGKKLFGRPRKSGTKPKQPWLSFGRRVKRIATNVLFIEIGSSEKHKKE